MSGIGMVIAVLFFGAGLAGTVIPFLPGAPLIWLGMLLYGFFVDFQNLNLAFYFWQAVLVGLTFLVGYVATTLGTKFGGGSKAAMRGAMVGLILGPILLGPPGFFLGPFVGAVMAELFLGRGLPEAFRAGLGALVGQVGGTVLNLIIELGMIAWFILAVISPGRV